MPDNRVFEFNKISKWLNETLADYKNAERNGDNVTKERLKPQAQNADNEFKSLCKFILEKMNFAYTKKKNMQAGSWSSNSHATKNMFYEIDLVKNFNIKKFRIYIQASDMRNNMGDDTNFYDLPENLRNCTFNIYLEKDNSTILNYFSDEYMKNNDLYFINHKDGNPTPKYYLKNSAEAQKEALENSKDKIIIMKFFDASEPDNAEKNQRLIEEIKAGLKLFIDKAKEIIKEENGMHAILDKEIEENGRKQIVLTGAPGTGKTYAVREYVKEKADEKHRCFVQFHPSYDYTDFVEGLRPVQMGNEMVFVRMDGQFKKFCREAAKPDNKDENFYFVIDEINRADLSKVFGELMYCMEESYRGKEGKVHTQYENLPTYEITQDGKPQKIDDDIFKDAFYIPENIIIIGTMNDIDRSVESFDFALRRRFRWINIKADDIMENTLTEIYKDKKKYDDTKVEDDDIKKLTEKAKKLNEVIQGEDGKKFGLNEDYCIGPAYFKTYYKTQRSDEVFFNDEIAPILCEYVRGRNGGGDFIEKCKTAFSESVGDANG